jgi:outer membrane protein assembly factor BamB
VVVNNNQLFFASPHGVFYSLDKITGKVIWRKIFDNTALYLGERKYDFADYYQSTPVIHDNVIYFGSGNNYFNALKADNGELLWTFKAGDIIHNTPVVLNNKVYFGCFDGNVYALNTGTGSLSWKFKTAGHRFFPNGEVEGSPAVSVKFGMVFIGARDYNFYALDANRGTCNWNRKFDGGWALSANLKDSIIYVGTADDKALIAYDALYGKQLWRTDVKSDIFGGCAFTHSMVYVGTFMGKFYGIDSKTGAILWTFTTDAHMANRYKYLKDDDSFRDDIYKILKAPIDLIAIEYDMGGIYSTPAIVKDQIIISTTEGTVYCLKK